MTQRLFCTRAYFCTTVHGALGGDPVAETVSPPACEGARPPRGCAAAATIASAQPHCLLCRSFSSPAPSSGLAGREGGISMSPAPLPVNLRRHDTFLFHLGFHPFSLLCCASLLSLPCPHTFHCLQSGQCPALVFPYVTQWSLQCPGTCLSTGAGDQSPVQARLPPTS